MCKSVNARVRKEEKEKICQKMRKDNMSGGVGEKVV